jgi:hypothetical protein
LVDGPTPLRRHLDLKERFEAERVRHDQVVGRFSVAQLLFFLGAAVVGGAGLFNGDPATSWGGGALFAAFVVLRVVQGRFVTREQRAAVRRDIHARHALRLGGRWRELPAKGDDRFLPEHPYASDLDLHGEGSLLQRYDVTHTEDGAATLARWLAGPADVPSIQARQAAVAELAPDVTLRQELEAAVLDTRREHLDPRPFLELMEQKGVIEEAPWLRFVAPTLPTLMIGLYFAGSFALVPAWAWYLPLAAQIVLVQLTDAGSARVFAALGSRRGFVLAFRQLFRTVEEASFEAPLLRRLQERLGTGDARPSVQLGRLDRWVAWYEMREQGLLHIVLNRLLLWDLNCLVGIEAWIARVGRQSDDWYVALGQIEALASLATLLDHDPASRLPEIADDGGALEAEGLVHPLLPVLGRVANDLRLPGPGSGIIVTGSNMAGKSTLLRALGVNVALALSGGPVTASHFRVPRVRLRASMRIADSLQDGASYFQAELQRLRTVVEEAEAAPPILFLLDELLRGTNARARHVGAKAVVEHLLSRGALGLVATHDIALSRLEETHPGRVENRHFTDVIADGEMTFDYRLRAGVVRTSNALRLLAEVGIDVEDDPHLLDGLAPAPHAEIPPG